MTKTFSFQACCFAMLFGAMTIGSVSAQSAPTVIRIGTQNTDLILQVADNGRLYQTYFGEHLLHDADINQFSWNVLSSSDGSMSDRGWEVYSCNGNEDYFEPALSVIHNDGNRTTYLYYQNHKQNKVAGGVQTDIVLSDNQYPIEVTLHYIAYEQEDVIKCWSEIRHQEKKPITLLTYATTMLYFNNPAYYLTEFSSDWANEAKMSSQRLQFGKKVIDTKLGSRAAMFTHPFFEVGLDRPVSEKEGNVLLGTVGWTGNFRFTFEVDNAGNLRVIPGINPYASDYKLQPNEVFETAEFIFTLSNQGASHGSRNLHDWARRYQVKDGMGDRLSLLNNWENTGFDFDQQILASFMHEAKNLGVDMFLLDDGWFGNGETARNDDHAGLGDWEVNRAKLPQGIPALVDAAKEAGVKFGIWIEPEMVNPRSELFKTHPDWAITLPNREHYYYRNQLVLDLSNPLTITQILWVNLVMDTLAALALGGEPALKRYMKEQPKRRDESIVSKAMKSQLTVSTIWIFLCSFFVLISQMWTASPVWTFVRNGQNEKGEWIYLMTAYFCFFILISVCNSLNVRTEKLNVFEHIGENPNYFRIMGLIIVIQVVMTYIGGEIFNCYGLNAMEWLLVVVLSISIVPVDLIRKAITNAIKKK